MSRDALTYGSLFSGIGLLDLGVEMAARDAGVSLGCAFQVELDPFCRDVLAKHWPKVPQHEDVTRVGSTGHAVPPVDLLVGGFPCTDVSLAGKGAGLHGGTRSGLWFEFLRLITELRPRGVLVENVPGLLRRGLVDVLSGLVAAGYAVEGTRIRAEDVGAPHRRERLFLVAYADGGRQQGVGRGGLLDGERPALRHDAHGRGGEDPQSDGAAQPGLGRDAARRPCWLDEARWPAPPGPQLDYEPPRTQANVDDRRARLKALGNSVVPACAYVAARRLLDRLEAAR